MAKLNVDEPPHSAPPRKGNGRGSYNEDDPDRPRWSKSTTHEDTFVYQRADGSYAYEMWKGKNADGEKIFCTRRRNTLGYGDRIEPEDKVEYYIGLGDEPPILYCLPELIAATKEPGAQVFATEGEKDVETAQELGLVATCNPFGALKWKDEYSLLLTGCDVIVSEDNDDRGRKHATKVARSVSTVAQRVRVLRLPGLKECGDFSDWIEGRRAEGVNDDDIRKELMALVDATPDWRPTIFCAAGQIPRMTDEAEAALIMARSEIYVHGSQLVQPVIEECDAAHDRKTKVARFRPMTEVTITEAMSTTATWLKQKANGQWIRTDPPSKVAKTLLERVGRWKFSRVASIITCPTLRPDGSLLSEPGYDPTTQLLLVAPPPMPSIPERPTKTEAEAALNLLNELLVEFPFVNDIARAVGLSMLLTTVARGVMICAPGHVVTAPEAGTGKSYLIDIASTLTTGRWCPVIASGKEEIETEKRLVAVLIKGQPIVSIDNVNGMPRGDLLCQMITQATVEVRELGLSKLITCDNRVTVFANGNNIKIVDDLVRRVVRCCMDAGMERPEIRKFNGNPVDVVLANRGKYIAAALTVVRAFIAAGRPGAKDLEPFQGFDGWNDNVRAALVWLGRADPAESVKSAREEDPLRATLALVVEAIAKQDFKHPVTAGELVRMAATTTGYGTETKYTYPELHDALMEAVGGERGTINGKALGWWFEKHKDRVVGEYKVVKTYDTHKKQQKWSLEKLQK
jgi:putative DNA primase/helicase